MSNNGLKNLSGRRKKHHLTKRSASSRARRSVLKRISQKYANVVTAVVVIQEISPFGKMQARKLFRKLPGRRVLERQHRRAMREITGSPHPLSLLRPSHSWLYSLPLHPHSVRSSFKIVASSDTSVPADKIPPISTNFYTKSSLSCFYVARDSSPSLCLSVLCFARDYFSLSREEYGKNFATLVTEVGESYETSIADSTERNRSLFSTTRRLQELPPLYRATRHQSLVVKKKRKKKKKIVAVNCFILDSNQSINQASKQATKATSANERASKRERREERRRE